MVIRHSGQNEQPPSAFSQSEFGVEQVFTSPDPYLPS